MCNPSMCLKMFCTVFDYVFVLDDHYEGNPLVKSHFRRTKTLLVASPSSAKIDCDLCY